MSWRVVGVDGCRGGWVAATVDGGSVSWSWSPEIYEVLDPAADAVGIDCPIGLPDSGPRACDVAARRAVGARRSSVFPAPLRAVLDVGSYADARAVLTARGAPSMSAQAFGIVRAVRQVDEVMSSALERRVIEVHPEASFARMRGEPLEPKRTKAGVAQRMSALRSWVDVEGAVAAAPRQARTDDALDALAVAWSARRWLQGVAEVLGDGARDRRNLVMRIVV